MSQDHKETLRAPDGRGEPPDMDIESFFPENSDRRPTSIRVYLARLLALALLASVTGIFSVLSLGPWIEPALADHGTRTLQVTPEKPPANPVGTTHTVTATLSSAPTVGFPLNIDFEIESGPAVTTTNNPASPGTPTVVGDGNTPQSPDMSCTITNPGTTCTVSFRATQTGTNLLRAWIDHDNNNATVEADTAEGRISDDFSCTVPAPDGGCTVTNTTTDCPPGDEASCSGAEVPGNTPEPDITDVVEKTWAVGAAARLDCVDDVDTNPSTGAGSAEDYICSLTDEFGNPVSGVKIDGENLAGANDPDDSATNTTADYNDFCPTNANGTCTVNIPATEGQAGVADICFWADTDGNNVFNPTSTVTADDRDGGDCDTEALTESPENNDLTDKVRKTWEHREARGLDAQPEAATNTVGSTHPVRGTVYDQFGAPFAGFFTINFEFFSGSPADQDGNTPGSPDLTCSTAGATNCAVAYTVTTATGTDLICAWISVTPTLGAPSMGVNTCDDPDPDVPAEGARDPTNDDGAPSPANDSVDVVQKTWVGQLEHLHLAFAPPTADPHDCSAGPTSDSETVGTGNPFLGCAHDQFGNPIPEVVVTPSIASGPGTVSPTTAATDGAGRATFTLNSTSTGQTIVTATARQGTITVPAENTVTKTWTAGEAAKVTLEPPSDQNVVGSTHTVTATVSDEFGNNVADGTTVNFTAAGTGAETPSSQTTTTEDGKATFTFTSSQTGTSTITAVAGSASATATKIWEIGPPASISVEPATASNQVNTTHTVTATVNDAGGNPLSGEPVTFTVGGTGAETPTVGTGTTDANGQVTFSFTSSKAGTSTITATSGTPTATATKVWTGGAPAKVVLDPKTDSNIVGTSHTVTATVTDEFDNPLSGTVVDFTAAGTGGENPSSGSAATDAQGRAPFTFTSDRLGRSTITATAGTATATATKVWLEAAPPTEPPKAATVQIIPEGATHSGLKTFVLIANPNTATVNVSVTFLTQNGPSKPAEVQNRSIAGNRRLTIDVNVALGEGFDVATKVEASAPVVAEGSLHRAGSRANLDMIGSPVASSQWIMAEGATHPGFTTFITVVNPDESNATTVEVTFLAKNAGKRSGGTLSIPAGSRRTLDVNSACECPGDDVSTLITAVGPPVVAGMSLHRQAAGDLGIGGSLGVTSPGDTWVVAEGATHSGWQTFVLVANPNPDAATVSVTYLTSAGPRSGGTVTIPGESRLTIHVNAALSALGVAGTDVSTLIDSVTGTVVVESTIQKEDATGFVIADSVASGGADLAAATGSRWLAAEGATHSGFTTFVLVSNPTSSTATITATFFTKTGSISGGTTLTVAPNSRLTINVNLRCGCVDDVSTLIEATGGTVVVEMSLDWAQAGMGFSKGRSLSARLAA